MGVSSNFDFLASQDEPLARLGALVERYFFDDAPSTLIKLRQLAELIAKEVAARHGLLPSNAAAFDDVLRALKVRSILPGEIADLFFHLKRDGNAAVHENIGTTAQAQRESLITSTEAARARADRLEAEAARARIFLDRLEAAILAKAFKGELVPQDPNDEPASVLLNRIRAQRASAPKSKRGRHAVA